MNQAIKIRDIMESNRVKVFDFKSSIPLEQQLTCPACERELKVACVFVSESTGLRMKFGVCGGCGYMGYIDRPSKKWMIDFYSTDWDKAFPKTVEEIKAGTILPGKGVKPERHLTASLVHKLPADKNKEVCEIGSGYGEVLKYFRDQGFKKVVGVENSQHRADMVHQILGFDVFQGGFEEAKVQNELEKLRPIGLFFSHHVLEHVYDPAEVIAKASALQEIGDHFILSLPNAAGEHINYALLYLVHLHSFTKGSLETLLNRYEYEIIEDNSPDDFNTIIAARKVQDPKPQFQRNADYLKEFHERVEKGLSVRSLNHPLNELYWEQNTEHDFSRTIPGYRNAFLQQAVWMFKKTKAYINVRLRRFTIGYKMLLSLGETDPDAPSLEIRFPRNIKFIIK